MEKDQLKILVKSVDIQLFEIVHNLICSICQELFNKPVTTPCGHSFCNGCIKRVLSSKNNSGCPLCKNPVKRYALESDEGKSTLSKICQELPFAFEKDVQDLANIFDDLSEELISTSKLPHLSNHDYPKDLKTSRQKLIKLNTKERSESKYPENDSETFAPVLKRSKNVHEYASAKKKKMDDLVSISQTEPASNSSPCDFFGLDRKLEKIEKVPPEEKVNEWFKAVGDNIYINSPSSVLGSDSKSRSEEDKVEGDDSSMIRRDNKSKVDSNSNKNVNREVDPYEFIPSQNNTVFKKKRKSRPSKKNIPDFKALQNFTKESIKRSALNLDVSKEDIEKEEAKDNLIDNQTTASQKFDQLLLESKQEEKKGHTLYTASQSSSLQFLDVSFNSKIVENVKKKKTLRVQLKQLDEDVLFKNTEKCTFGEEERSTCRTKKRSADKLENGKKKKLLVERINETSQSEESMNSKSQFLIKKQKSCNRPSTKLETLLEELLDDDIIYATRPANAPVRLPELNVVLSSEDMQNLQTENTFTESTQLIGFCTQEETSDEKQFKEMVENLEKELNFSECLVAESNRKSKDDWEPTVPDPIEDTQKKNFLINEDESSFRDLHETPSKIRTTRLVEFFHLGKLTPVRKRTKSTVVKLVFPIGLTSLARRRAFESKQAPKSQILKKQACQKSTGIQTSQQFFSSMVQTSHEVKPSVDIQTTQKVTTSAKIQTSQRLVCQEMQTSQVACNSAQVQTSQPQGSFTLNLNPELPKTPVRKPSHQHLKIIQRKNYEETLPDFSLQNFTFKKSLSENELIMDFDNEKKSEETQKYEQLVELKNKKNKEKNEESTDIQQKVFNVYSDDSDIEPPKRRNSFNIFSEESNEIVEDFETRQLIPLDVRRVSLDEETEVIDLDTPVSQNSEGLMLRVLENINLDLPKRKSGAGERGEKSEESDSDFFIEQTPPRPASRSLDDIRSISKARVEGSQASKEKKEFSEGTDLICDSIPKGFSESFQILSAPKRLSLTPEKSLKDETQRKTLKIDSTVSINLPDENDQNQLNAFEGKTKTMHLMNMTDAWKPKSEMSSPVKNLCIVASSVKNPDMIKKFVSRFKIEYLTKPTKDMTHLIVGLHENEDQEVLPLCTPKLLFAMANKKWVVSELWAEACLKMNVILPEDNFETLDPVGGCGCRKSRLSSEKLLKNCEIFLLGEFQMISKKDFADLILDCGGTLVSSPEKFSYSPLKLRLIIADGDCLQMSEKQLQEHCQKYSTVVVSRDVIVMSIQSYSLVNLAPYLLHPASEEYLVQLGYPLSLVRNEAD